MYFRQFITVQTPDTNEYFDLEVPADQKIAEIMPSILKVLKHSEINPIDKRPYYLWRRNGEKLNMTKTFKEIGITNFSVMILDSKPPANLNAVSQVDTLDIMPAFTPLIQPDGQSQYRSVAHNVLTDQKNDNEGQKPPSPTPEPAKTPERETSTAPPSPQLEEPGKTIQELVAKKKKPGVVKPRQSN